jgi:hypothetical protein
MKKIFVILATRNEGDIIESFCRYNLTFCDGMIIYERQSSDNTNEIIRKLIAEGLPIHLYDDPNVVLGPFAEGNVKTSMAHRAINEYSADLVLSLDTDEFLYHIDGINPRETLEALREDVEYQALWRTYVYEKEPDIKLGFMPNNFTHYRNPVLEDTDKYERHKKVIASGYLIKDDHATFVDGSHFLLYPKEYNNSVKIEILKKLVFAHFPVRSKTQVMRKVIPNWIYRWAVPNHFPRSDLDVFQLGVIFNDIRDNGEITFDKIKQYSIEYAMMLDFDKLGKRRFFNREEIENIKRDLGEELTIASIMKTSFCSNKLKLRYTNYNEDNKIFMRATLTEIDRTLTYLSTESDEKSKLLTKYLPAKISNIYMDTGNGFNQEEVISVPLFRHENYFEASVTLPVNVKNVRFNPVAGFGCVIDNMQIVTDAGNIEYTPINGIYADGLYIFDNPDPQIFIDFEGKNITHLQITGNMRHFIIENIKFLSKTLSIISERDSLLNSRSWRITKPLRDFVVFVRRHKLLYFFAKVIWSIYPKRKMNNP